MDSVALQYNAMDDFMKTHALSREPVMSTGIILTTSAAKMRPTDIVSGKAMRKTFICGRDLAIMA